MGTVLQHIYWVGIAGIDNGISTFGIGIFGIGVIHF
jgi:hypothetical protein